MFIISSENDILSGYEHIYECLEKGSYFECNILSLTCRAENFTLSNPIVTYRTYSIEEVLNKINGKSIFTELPICPECAKEFIRRYSI